MSLKYERVGQEYEDMAVALALSPRKLLETRLALREVPPFCPSARHRITLLIRNTPPSDPTVDLCLGSYGGPWGHGGFL